MVRQLSDEGSDAHQVGDSAARPEDRSRALLLHHRRVMFLAELHSRGAFVTLLADGFLFDPEMRLRPSP
jgi:hypothetical protein